MPSKVTMQTSSWPKRERTPNDLFDILPVTYHMAHQLPEFPGVARYPIDEWESAGSPTLTTKGWIKMCMRIAQKNMSELHTVFEAAQKLDPSTANDFGAPWSILPVKDCSLGKVS